MTRTAAARVAGFTFLFYIVVGISSMAGTFRGTAAELATYAQNASAVILALTLFLVTRVEHRVLAALGMMELEAAEALDPRRFGQRIQDARVRFERVFEAIENLAETPRDVLNVALGVRRRVLFFSALTLIGWSAVLAAFWITQGPAGLRLFDRALTVIAIAGGVLSLALLWFSILEVRRLPSEGETRRLSRYPRRIP